MARLGEEPDSEGLPLVLEINIVTHTEGSQALYRTLTRSHHHIVISKAHFDIDLLAFYKL